MSLRIIDFLFFVLVFYEVRSQVCNTTVVSNKASYSDLHTSCTDCPNVTSTSYSEYHSTLTTSSCCPGYKLRNATKSPSRCNCVRVCDACSHGNCTSGNRCNCFESYERYPPQSNTCVRKCEPGYERTDGICKRSLPTCYPDCGHGDCIGVNMCKCDTGFELSENGSSRCVPTCKDCNSEGSKKDMLIYLVRNLTNEVAKNITIRNKIRNTGFSVLNHTDYLDAEELEEEPSINNYPLLNYLYTSFSLNIVLLLIFLILIWKNPEIFKCCRIKRRTSSGDSLESTYHQYEVIKGDKNFKMNLTACLQNNSYTRKLTEINEGNDTEEPLRYDYVQVPLPINQRF